VDVSVQHPLARVAAYLQSPKPGSERIGPFLAGFTPHTSNPYLNYAVPLPGAVPTPAEVAALVAAFTQRGLLPRLEFLPSTAPQVEPALLAAGFTVELRPPLLACTPADRRDPPAPPAPPGIEFCLATGPAVLRAVLAVQHEAFGEPAPPSEHDLARAVRHVERGGLTGLARDTATGAVVAGGQALRPRDGVAELVGVAVAASHRRCGIGTGLAAFLTRASHDRGADLVWLEAAGRDEQRVYERAGYQVVGEKVYLSKR
jgi:ribosomal protein S18 acetylase RimI-like enzyme